jgi:hypothetical protein
MNPRLLRNAVKVVFGSAIGAGVGYAASKLVEEREAAVATPDAEPEYPRETFKERLTRAREAGEAARVAKEADMRAYFRQKVHDPEAMTSNPTP